MSDLIDRQAAIDEIKALYEWYDTVTEDRVIDHLKRLPSSQQWIPMMERLPSLRDETYLVSLAWGGVGTMEFKDTGWHNYGSLSPVPIETVTAWMPLPGGPYHTERKDRK